MKRHFLILLTLAAVLICVPMESVKAAGRGGHGGHMHGGGRGGFGRGFGGFGILGGGFDYGWDISELYRQLYNNLPYFALHPPVYYSQPVPRTYGYSPFAYPPGTMTPEIVEDVVPVTINNPYVPRTVPGAPAPPAAKTDRSASVTTAPEPLVIVNPFVTPSQNVAKRGS